MRSLLTALTLILAIGMTDDADARRRSRTVDRTPAPSPVCNSAGVRVDCITFLPIEDSVRGIPSTTGEPVRPERERYNVVTVGIANDNELLSPITPALSLNTTNHTLEQFNDSRVAVLHNRVADLINAAIQNTPRPLTPNSQRRLLDEIQVRLDLIADGTDRNRIIDRYWTLSYPDRMIVYVKPPNNVHVLTYTIQYGD